MIRLSVNVNKLATLRNARGQNNPNVLQTSLDIVRYGAQGITVHPRPDGRHIRHQDVIELAAHLPVPLNIEGYPSPEFLKLVLRVKPDLCTLVPDPPELLTSNQGWDLKQQVNLVTQTIARLQEQGIRTALFMSPEAIKAEHIHLLVQTKTNCVELYTQAYADTYETPQGDSVLNEYIEAAHILTKLGIKVHAGHDLNAQNLAYLARNLPMMTEVSIGHALICDALYLGLEQTVQRYLACLQIMR